MVTTMLRWTTRGAVALAALCLVAVGFTFAEQNYYQRAAHRLAISVITHEGRLAVPLVSESEAPAVDGAANTTTTDAPKPQADPDDPPSLIGELEVPHLRIATAIVEGDDGTALRRGAGHVPGTAFPGESGNVVLAGHRDTVFRRLGELQRGDRLRLTTRQGVFDYRVARTLLVSPRDVWVVERHAAALTLITCYPFDWIGAAPQRWIVQAEPIGGIGASPVAQR
jgi:sortase A